MNEKNIIIANLIGGLGNQMFQYAAGLSMAIQKNVPYKIDTSDFRNYKLHKYSLDKWNISAAIATSSEVQPLKSKRLFFLKNKEYREFGFNFDAELFKQSPPVYIKGYWQSEKYFINVRDLLLKEFTPKNPLSEFSQGILNLLEKSSLSISLHIRRGDYLLEKNQKIHGVCGLDYYESAILQFENQYKNATFFIFSDDIQWAKDNLKFNSNKIWVDGNDSSKNFEDIYLMSRCNHNIIANSSFSWWGAWLNNHGDKKIIAPKAWFHSDQYNASDLCCPSWVLL